MALSLESIHQPLTDFFLNQFKTDAGSPILFRFDKFGSVLSDQDFINPSHPELGYLPALAMEKFSDLVNHIPIDTGDGANILLSADSIDTTYFFRLLTPSIPYIPDGMDGDTQQAIIQAFSTIKADSVRVWNSLKAESITGLMLQYKPSLATPENWYDKSKNEVWTSHSFQVTETSSVSAPGPSTQLWKLKLSDVVMREALQLPEAISNSPEPPQLNITTRVLELQANTIVAAPVVEHNINIAAEPSASHNISIAAEPAALHSINIATESVSLHNINIAAEQPISIVGVAPAASLALQDTYLEQYNTLNVSQKLLANQYLGTYTPTQSVKTSSISISFDYCLVNIRRPWYIDVFVNDKSWCVPTEPKGQVTSSGPVGNLPLMPIGFVVIRNLNIEANWTTEDIANASLATDFGPFKVTANIVNNKLSHPGLQIIGWMLQKMPGLPPNDSPSSGLSSTTCTIIVNALHIRAQPTSQSTAVATYPRGTVLNLIEVVNGENVDGNPRWGHSEQGHYFWLGGTDHPNG